MKGTLGNIYGISDRQTEARAILAELQEQSTREYISAQYIALVYTGLGETDQTFTWLDHAYEERFPVLAYLKVFPLYDPLRSDPRFTALLQKIGLE